MVPQQSLPVTRMFLPLLSLPVICNGSVASVFLSHNKELVQGAYMCVCAYMHACIYLLLLSSLC